MLLDAGWRFCQGDDATWAAADVDAADWLSIDLPHDWSIRGERLAAAPAEGHGGYFPGGVGWYRRTFRIPASWKSKRIAVEFEGAYRRTEVWCNGRLLGNNTNGYLPFRFDLTPHLKPEGENVLAVRVENDDLPNSRWYTGSGIYRHARLAASNPVFADPASWSVTTLKTDPDAAVIRCAAQIRNESPASAMVHVEFALVDPAGRREAAKTEPSTVAAGEAADFTTLVRVPAPQLWSLDHPHLYDAVVRTYVDGRLVDDLRDNVGIRTVALSSERGFLLNGQPLKLVGGNLHHDHGPLGAASFDMAEERRVRLLKAAGFDAIRTSHNPQAPAFLAACDRLGMLVVAEGFDHWEASKTKHDDGPQFAERGPDEIERMVRRDRRHPSIVMWSIGNEVYERGKQRGVELARELAQRVREIDPSRPATIGLNGLGPNQEWAELDPLFALVDATGYNYELHRAEEDRRRVPGRLIYGSETYPRDVFADWHAVQQHHYVFGAFVWSAVDYLGEAGIGRVFPPGEEARPHWVGNHFPSHGADCGDLDLLGRRRPHSHYRNIVWNRGERLFAAVQVPEPDGGRWQPTLWSPPMLADHWTWPGLEGRPLQVEVFSRCDTIRVLLNDSLVAEQSMSEETEFRAVVEVPYEPGRLTVVGLEGGREIERCELAAAGEPVAVRLVAESPAVPARRQSIAFVTVEVVDAAGEVCPHADHRVEFAVTGPATIVAVSSADLATTESYLANPRKVYQGRGQVILRANGTPGAIRLRATAPGLLSAEATILGE
ncbi:MAG: DUF4982 domain-containing protein [Pirellulales bacterium]|nr:DUF4982 domain-containing protein [Pirellulales bacterium]